MLNLKLIALLIIAGSSVLAASSITYYYAYTLPKKDQEVLALQIAKLTVTPTVTPTLTLTPTISLTATPTATIRYIAPSATPTKMGVLDLIQANNKCVGDCFRSQEGKDNASCANNWSSSCYSILSQDEKTNCINTCKSKYNQ